MSLQGTDIDWGATRTAQRQREEKARLLAAAAWAQGYGGGDVPTLDATERRKLVRLAGVHQPSGGSTTWDLVELLLTKKDDWAARHPDHPDSRRPPRPALSVPDDAPRGWAALAAEGLMAGVRCAAVECAREAVAWVSTRGGSDEARCAGHPPVGDEWGAHLDWSPKPCAWPIACWCHRHAGLRPTPIAMDGSITEGAHS